MPRFLPLAALLAALVAWATGPVLAATEAPYTDAAFAAAQKQGRPILVAVDASWCPTCAKQRPILAELETDPRFKDLHVFKVDFDAQKDALRALGVRMQSTLIAFHGTAERARATGLTDEGAIRDLVAKAQE